jgi:hypothetical protein
MRPIVLVIGIILLLTGCVWALQGAYVLPATFMRGGLWTGIGAAVAAAGLLIAWLGWRRPRGSATASPRDV